MGFSISDILYLGCAVPGGSGSGGAVESVNGKTGVVVLDAKDVDAVPQLDTMPTASADYVGVPVQYSGATNANSIHGYIYECAGTPVYSDTTTFEAATISGTVVTETGNALSLLAGRFIHNADVTDIVSGTLTYDSEGNLWIFVGKDAQDTTVGQFQLYQEDYEDAGFTFTGTPENGDVVAFSTEIAQTSTTYAWNRVDVQPQPAKELPAQAGNSGKFLTTNGISPSWATVGGLPSQTGQSGKFLTTDGTDASWSDKPLVNNTTRTGSIEVGSSTNTANYTVAIGIDSYCIGSGSVVIGNSARSTKRNCVAIGYQGRATANGSIIINASGGERTNTHSGTVVIANETGTFEIMSADGTIPADRFASTSGLADGNYRLRLTMASGVPTLTWVAE